jgi:hypothetical protein
MTDGEWVGAHDGPVPVRRAAPLTAEEKRLTGLLALAPIGLALAVLVPIAAMVGANAGEVISAALVYGGLLGLAVGFVAVDRLQARQCPRCRSRPERGAEVCLTCGYDLEHRPRFACEERHLVYLDDDGSCECGRRLQPLPIVRGVGREIVFMIKLGAGLLIFLLVIGVVLQVVERNV